MRRELSVLADDSMEGRGTGTRGERRAARYIAAVMREIGLAPAGTARRTQMALEGAALTAAGRPPARPDTAPAGALPDTGARASGAPSGEPDTAALAAYLQSIPATRSGRRVRVLADRAALERLPPGRRLELANVIGILPGGDPRLRGEFVVVDAHYDHLGMGSPVRGDSIFNGADDDASGVVAVLEIARALAAGPRPRRSVLFMATTGEEVGMLGIEWYVSHPVVPLGRTVANLEIEQIGRPDPLAGGHGRAWLSGFERSTMGRSFRDAGLPIIPDPHAGQEFFQRSDNIVLAEAGVPAHTLSSFALHTDYHERTDELATIDFEHMTALIGIAVRAVQLLADGSAPRWYAGGRPSPSFH